MKNLLPFILQMQMFADEPTPPAEEEKETPPAEEKHEAPVKSVAETLKEIREKTVPKSRYDELQKQLNDVVKSVINGDGPKPAQEQTARKVDDIRKELLDEKGTLTNLEFVKDTLELRKQLMEEGKPDLFLPTGTNVEITSDDIAKAKNLADCLEHCVEYADGDSETFTTELMRITKDVQLPKRKS